MDDYATINDTREISQKTTYLLRNIDMGTREFARMGYCVDNMQRMWMDESQMKMSSGGHTSQSHKRIAQNNRAKQDDIMSKNGND